jgi:hypothetical protein
MPEVYVRNPAIGKGDDGGEVPGRTAIFGWGGQTYEIKPGEMRGLEEHLAQHARKHNPWLKLMDESDGALSVAECEVKIAEQDLSKVTQELQAKTTELKRAQNRLLSAKGKLDTEKKIREKELAELTAKG